MKVLCEGPLQAWESFVQPRSRSSPTAAFTCCPRAGTPRWRPPSRRPRVQPGDAPQFVERLHPQPPGERRVPCQRRQPNRRRALAQLVFRTSGPIAGWIAHPAHHAGTGDKLPSGHGGDEPAAAIRPLPETFAAAAAAQAAARAGGAWQPIGALEATGCACARRGFVAAWNLKMWCVCRGSH